MSENGAVTEQQRSSGWAGVQDPALRQRIQVVRQRAEQRIKNRAQQRLRDGKQIVRGTKSGRQAAKGR